MTDFPETNRFPLTLTKEMVKESIFIKKKMTEKCNVGKLLGVIKRKEGQDIEWDDNPTSYKNENPMFKDYYETFKEEEFHTSYYLPKHKFGRCNPKGWLSLSVFRRGMRHSFAEGIYKDIDMKNAHPVLLSVILTQQQPPIPCVKLTEYARNPTEIRQDIMAFYNLTKDEAKKLIFRMCYGGSYTEWCKEQGTDRIHPFLLALENELTNIQIVIHTANKETIVKEVKKQDPTKWTNPAQECRGAMALYAQSVERLIQEKAIAWLVSNKGLPLEKIVPSQDGFMILEEYWYDGLTDDINRVIEDEMNIPIEFVVKPFDEAIEIEEWFGKPYAEWVDDLSCKRLADRFLKEFGNNICMYQPSHSLYVFDGTRWFDETDEKTRHKIINLLSETLYGIIKTELDEDCSLTPVSQFTLGISLRTNTSTKCNLTNFYLHLLANVRRIPNDFNSNQFVLGFENGLYDLKTSVFRPYTFEDYVTITTGYNYGECDLAKKEVLLGIFKEIIADPEKYGAFMRILASGLDGLNHQHLFLFNGTGRNGKGFTTRLMKRALGTYFYQGSNEIIKDSVKAGSASPLLYNLKNKRYVVFPEVAGLIKNDLLKLLTGGDAVNARLLHKNPESFSLSGTFVLEFNKPPEMEQKCGHSERARIVDLDFPVNFTSDEAELLKGGTYKRGNPEYTKDAWIDGHQLEMLHILLDVYKEHKEETGGIDFKLPNSLRQRTEAFIENQNPFVKIMKEYYAVDEKAEKVKIKTIWDRVKDTEEYRSMTSRQKREFSRDELYEYVKKNYDTKTIDQATFVYNIREIYDEPDNI
jgi:phage/plasmid-associated DNA primase